MNSQQFNTILERMITQDRKIGETKGADYTIGSDDRLNNFKQVGELVCCPHCKKSVGPRAVWAVYVLKHMLAILAWVKTGKVESEGLEGRFVDTRVYAALGQAIAEEQAVMLPTQHEKQRQGPADRRVTHNSHSSLGRRMCLWNSLPALSPGRRSGDRDNTGWMI